MYELVAGQTSDMTVEERPASLGKDLGQPQLDSTSMWPDEIMPDGQ